jgi:S-adenosylmethionine hydrolase
MLRFSLALILILVTLPVTAEIKGTIIAITSEYGNVTTDITADALAKEGIEHGGKFQLRYDGKTYEVTLATTYSDVEKGEWVAFIIEEIGSLRLARNLENAATTLDCAEGDTVSIMRK